MAARKTLAMVQTAPRKLEPQELLLPEIDHESALLRIEACGICGSDYEQYDGVLRTTPARVKVWASTPPRAPQPTSSTRAASRRSCPASPRGAKRVCRSKRSGSELRTRTST